MSCFLRRCLLALILALALALSPQPSLAARPAHAAATWQLGIGGESADGALQVQAFLPTTLTIDAGDTVQWTMNPQFVHTVTFLSGGQAPPVATAEGDTVVQPAATAFPSGGPTYDGSGFVNSGLLEGKGATFALTFSKAGSYGYLCLLHPGMAGTIVVQPADSAYPLTQAQVSAQANAELYAKLSQGNQDLQSAQPSSTANADGTTSYTVVNGAGGNQVSVLRFLPVELTVKAGDRVSWLGNDPHEVHTVTFYDPAGKVPEFIVPQPQASGPPRLVLPHGAPENDTAVDSQDLYNSGLLTPGARYTFSFPKVGVYTYVCVVHAPQGMFGKVVVVAAAPGAAGGAGQPARLPTTAEGGQMAPLLLVGGALLLVLLGLRLRRRRGA